MTSDTTITIAKGLVIADETDMARAIACQPTAIELEKAPKLLDVPQSAQTLLYLFFRSAAFVGKDFLGFFFEHVDYELVDRFVARCVRALLHAVIQLAFNLYFG